MKPGLKFQYYFSTLRPSSLVLKQAMAYGLCSVLATGCVAQQADLARIQKDLELQISKIQAEKRALGAQVEEARSAITESNNLLAQQKADIAKMQSDLAPRTDFAGLNQQMKLMREQDLAVLHGSYEEAEKRIGDLEKSLQEHSSFIQSEIGSLQATVHAQGETLQSQGEQIQRAQTQTTTLAQEMDTTTQTLTNTMAEFQQSLGHFKEALGEVGTKVSTQREDLMAQETRLGAQDEKLQILETGSNQLSDSLIQLREAVEKSGTLVGERLDEQGGQVTQLQQEIAGLRQNVADLPQLQQEVAGLRQNVAELPQLQQEVGRLPELKQEILELQEKLEKDTQALRTYLEQDVKTALSRVVTDMESNQEPVFARIDSLQKDMEILGTHVQADATHVQDLSQSVLKLREAQEVMGSLLGKRGDEVIQQAGQLSERMNTVEAHQTALTEQLQSNNQKTSSHLAEVNANLNSISRALDQTNQSLSSRLAKQEEAVQNLNQTLQQFQQLAQTTKDHIQQMQSAKQLTGQLRQSVEEISSRLHDLEIHQSGLVGKLDADAQVTNTHLQDVNSGINSVGQALESVSSKLNTRIDDQEQRLNKAMTTFQRVQGAADISQNNLNHLNRLTETVNQLRDVVNTIGIKLGERVDQHEDRLGQLAQRVNRLQGPKTQKK